jgi:hypothetical protein
MERAVFGGVAGLCADRGATDTQPVADLQRADEMLRHWGTPGGAGSFLLLSGVACRGCCRYFDIHAAMTGSAGPLRIRTVASIGLPSLVEIVRSSGKIREIQFRKQTNEGWNG